MPNSRTILVENLVSRKENLIILSYEAFSKF